jgi:hypothetical protein
MFLVAGSASIDYNGIQETNILSNGNLDEWNSVNTFPEEIYWHQIATNQEYIYSLGGNNYPPPTSISRNYYGTLESNSSVNWSMSRPLPSPRSAGGAVSVANRIYYLGGMSQTDANSEPVHNDVYYTGINSDGSLNEWKSTTPLAINQPRYYFGVVETGKKILTIGGKYDADNRFSRKVFQSDVDPTTGELGSWTETYPLPDNNGSYSSGYNSVGVIRVGDYIIAVGGAVCCGNQSKKVYYTKITQDGGIEPWQTSQYDLPIRSTGGQVQYVNGYLYYMGGYSNDIAGGYHDKVYFTNLDIPVEPPSGTSLNVPDLKQYSLPWGPLAYDHSNSTPPTISRWGCALTSAAMILQYYGSTTDPQVLNDWLRQNNGYKRNGSVIWSAVSTFSQIDPNTPTLEFDYPGYTESKIKSEINENRPVFVKLENIPYGGNHFITVKGFDNSNIFINDPAKATHPTLSDANSYWGSNISIGHTPSNTDLSYIVLATNNNIDIKVFNPTENEIGSEYYHTEYPMLDPDNPDSTPEGETLKSLYYPKPQDGLYKIEVSGEGVFQLDSYLYDVDGNSTTSTAKGNLSSNETRTFYVLFNGQSTSILVDESLMNILETLGEYDSTNVYKRGIYNHIRNSLLNINTHILTSQDSVASRLIELLQTYIDENKKEYLEEDYYSLLSLELQSLYASTTLSSYLAGSI